MAKLKMHIAIIAGAAALLSACTTIKMPTIDVPGVPEFKEAAAKLVDGYPEVSDAPVRPGDLRSEKSGTPPPRRFYSSVTALLYPQRGMCRTRPSRLTPKLNA